MYIYNKYTYYKPSGTEPLKFYDSSTQLGTYTHTHYSDSSSNWVQKSLTHTHIKLTHNPNAHTRIHIKFT